MRLPFAFARAMPALVSIADLLRLNLGERGKQREQDVADQLVVGGEMARCASV
jgi:hypothetical protein